MTQSVTYHHFKMDTLMSAITLMTPNCYKTSIDMKDAYYTVSVAAEHRKFLRFTWRGHHYQFTALPNGPESCPSTFTKLLKPPIAHLRQQGVEIVQYLDDNYIRAHTFQEATQNSCDFISNRIHCPSRKVCAKPNSRNHLSWFPTELCDNVCGTCHRKGKGNKGGGPKTRGTVQSPVRVVTQVTGKLVACLLPAVSYTHLRAHET